MATAINLPVRSAAARQPFPASRHRAGFLVCAAQRHLHYGVFFIVPLFMAMGVATLTGRCSANKAVGFTNYVNLWNDLPGCAAFRFTNGDTALDGHAVRSFLFGFGMLQNWRCRAGLVPGTAFFCPT